MKIKTLTLSAGLLFGMIMNLQADSGRGTANYYKAQADSFEDKKVSLDITHLSPRPGLADVDDLHFFIGHTADTSERAYGGSILIVTTGDTKKLINKYGTQPDRDGGGPKHPGKVDTKGMRGIFRSLEKGVREHYYIDVDGSAQEVLEAHIDEVKRLMGGTPGKKKHKKGKFK